ncbi:heterokaryon incompatibility protein [Diplodia corticola]|uniref:Heterokaryon incompatibility protein n=1 Tax=Diplodia corticola TaxID=236234 RepID=A0A1J9S438_9PEZI|nr:heterokaryon incompatibility protein [Diplodia corticola]OJD35303.1 heterokaryon incompatibility protein [Diplodia corticola]
MAEPALDLELRKAYGNLGDFETSTFQFARSDGITADAANIYPQHVDRLFPLEHVSQWAETKRAEMEAARAQMPKPGDDETPEGAYNPIIDRHEIRILELLPGHFSDKLKGALHHCSVEFEFDVESDERPYDVRYFRTRHGLSMEDLTQPVWYTALSYTWGVPNPSTDSVIECDGFELKITHSLDVALRHFRQTDDSINLWIDQICIDQSNQREKEQQIPLMSKIYRHAVNTVVWLGEASEGSDNAFELLKFIGTVFQMTVDAPPPQDFERLFLPSAHDGAWKHLWDLVNRPWFNRLWIVQECILSDNLWVVCGDTTVYWEELTNGFSNLVRSGLADWLQSEHGQAGPDSQTRGWDSMHMLGEERTHYHSFQQTPSLFGLLSRTRNAQASDPRDKVYGLLGVCTATGIQVSYDPANTVAAVYHAATLACLGAGREYLPPILSCVDHSPQQQRHADLPSWVPDWSLPRQTSPLGLSTSSNAIYRAGGRSPTPHPLFSLVTPTAKPALRLPGKIFHPITALTPPCDNPDISAISPSTANAHFLPWIALALAHCHPYPAPPPSSSGTTPTTPTSTFTAFHTTLVAGSTSPSSGQTLHTRAPAAAFAETFSLLLDATTGRSPTFPDQTYSARQRRPLGKGRLELAHLRGERAPGKTCREAAAAVRRAVRGRRLAALGEGEGWMGLCPGGARVGDRVVVVEGVGVPFVVREVEGEEGEEEEEGGEGRGERRWRLVGECYVHGIMDGEVMGMEGVPRVDVVLV